MGPEFLPALKLARAELNDAAAHMADAGVFWRSGKVA
jgi:hypothetical protein